MRARTCERSRAYLRLFDCLFPVALGIRLFDSLVGSWLARRPVYVSLLTSGQFRSTVCGPHPGEMRAPPQSQNSSGCYSCCGGLRQYDVSIIASGTR